MFFAKKSNKPCGQTLLTRRFPKSHTYPPAPLHEYLQPLVLQMLHHRRHILAMSTVVVKSIHLRMIMDIIVTLLLLGGLEPWNFMTFHSVGDNTSWMEVGGEDKRHPTTHQHICYWIKPRRNTITKALNVKPHRKLILKITYWYEKIFWNKRKRCSDTICLNKYSISTYNLNMIKLWKIWVKLTDNVNCMSQWWHMVVWNGCNCRISVMTHDWGIRAGENHIRIQCGAPQWC